MTPTSTTLSGTGIWSGELRYGAGGLAATGSSGTGEIAEAAAELEALGYSAVWVPDVGGDLFAALDRLLSATRSMTVASGILNIWMHDATETASWRSGLGEPDRDRLLLGLGVSHGPLIGDRWARPIEVTRSYLDGLDAAGVPPEARCLAALGPRMLELAAARSAGAHPYLGTPEHTARARAVLGPDALLAPEQGVVLDTDPGRARETARHSLRGYAGLPNYSNNWVRLGFSPEEIAGLSDRLVDHLVAWGDAGAISARVQAHRDAGASHVCIQVLSPPDSAMPREAWRELAPALT